MYRVTVYEPNNGKYLQQFFDSQAVAEGYAWKYERRGFDAFVQWVTATDYEESLSGRYVYPLT